MPRITILRNDRSSRLLRAIGPILLFLPLLPPQAFAQEAAPPTIVYLVRHAEKDTTDTTNPELTPEGKVRAEALAALLEDAGIDAIYSTDFRRTRQTAAPLATHLDLEVVRYDPRGLPAFAARLRTLPGRHLVSGHSDTTPALVRLLGGDPGPPIPDSEYDRLYILVIPPQGEVTTVVIRYGARSHGEG